MRGEIGDGGVIVEGGENGGANHEEPFVVDGGEEDRDPPALAAAVDDESRQEEADKNWALHIDIVLVMPGGLCESDEEKESEDEDHLVVRRENGESEEEKVNDSDPGRNRIFALDPAGRHVGFEGFLAPHAGEFLFE